MSKFKPVAVGLVTSGSRGNRLVFYHRGSRSGAQAHSDFDQTGAVVLGSSDVASVLPPTTLAEILAPSSLMVNRKFELSVDQWKFVGHPFFVQNGVFSITFNVVFVLESFYTDQVVEGYNHLSHLIGSAIVHEEMKCGFLCQEVKLLMQLLEEADIPNPSADNLLQRSSLAKSLCTVLTNLQAECRHIQVKFNEFSEVDTLLNFGTNLPVGQKSNDESSKQDIFIVRSYSALLLFQTADDIIASLPPSSNPAMQRLLSVVSPLKNLQAVSLDADIPLVLVLHLASHLVHWGKAMAIYPLSENNTYITSPTADTRIYSQLSAQFTDKFPDQCLADVLSNFSLPVPLSDIKEIIEDEGIVIWLLQHKQIIQLHTYVYIVPSNNVSMKSNKRERAKGKHERPPAAVEEMLAHLTSHERACVLHTSAAGNHDDLEEFARLSQYFHGNHHLEGIMLTENIPRSQLLTLIDKFSEVLHTTPVLLRRLFSSCASSEGGRNGTLYVHWPYCTQLCTYCNFNKYLASTAIDKEHMYTCLVKELQSVLKKSTISSISSVYFGGGTPSLAGGSLVDTVLNALTSCSILEPQAEVCMEANPSSAKLTQLKELKTAGVNRLSLGLQSLDDEDLQLMNRDHTSDQGWRTLQHAVTVFPGRVNVDVIFGRPEQTLTKWKREIEELTAMADNHVSMYQLTVEPGTPLAKAVSRGELTLPDEDTMADLYECGVQVLEGAGLRRYEVSNFAREGFESRHNLCYWTGVDYIGIGPGAHSRYLSSSSEHSYTHSVNIPEPKAWTRAVQAKGDGIALEKLLSKSQRLEEVIATSLRTRDGLINEIWRCFSRLPLLPHASHNEPIQDLVSSGLLHLDNRGLRATGKGLNVLDSVLPPVLSLVSVSAECALWK